MNVEGEEEESSVEITGGRARSNSFSKKEPVVPDAVSSENPKPAESKIERSNLTERELKALRKVKLIPPLLLHTY